MVLDLELFCQLAVGNVIAPGETFDCQKCLMLVWRQPYGLSGRFAEPEKAPKRVAECRQRFILFLAQTLT
jgi:hypothetical protein